MELSILHLQGRAVALRHQHGERWKRRLRDRLGDQRRPRHHAGREGVVAEGHEWQQFADEDLVGLRVDRGQQRDPHQVRGKAQVAPYDLS